MKKTMSIGIIILYLFSAINAQTVKIMIDTENNNFPISPYLYGKNNSTSQDSTKPTNSTTYTQIRESGATILRENTGNACTKYNWKKKMSSGPDWFNNIFYDNWDAEARGIQNNLPDAQIMYGFQLLGYAAKTGQYNYNGTIVDGRQNLAGNGTPNTSGTEPEKALKDGDFKLYLEEWPVDSSVKILDHWFGTGGLGFKKEKFLYWSMDNEPDIWSSTHDDVIKTQPSAEEFLKNYFKLAKLARAKYPQIKLVGPVTANEWFWYDWPGKGTEVNGKKLPWLEYFIKRIGEEQKASGVRLLDVLAIHLYPGNGETKPEQWVQMHRIYFDTTYSFPYASGVKLVNGGWDESLNKEYIFLRCNRWLEKYLGPNHHVGLGVTETGIHSEDPNVNAILYASTMGEFMKNSVELFTPWSWKKGMWETLHLFARNNKSNFVQSVSDQEEFVSAYTSIDNKKDSMTVIFVNRSASSTKNIETTIKGFSAKGNHTKLELSDLPSNKETFISEKNNALKVGTATVQDNKLSLSLPPFSITAVLLKSSLTGAINTKTINSHIEIITTNGKINIVSPKPTDYNLSIFDLSGKSVFKSEAVTIPGITQIDLKTIGLQSGYHIVKLSVNNKNYTEKLFLSY